MAFAESNMLPLGTIAPEFNLPNTVDDKYYTFKDLHGEKATVVMFLCNHCPYVIHVNEQLVKLANDYMPKGVNFIAISSNDVQRYPQDSPEKMKELAKNAEYPFPYLYDETQEVAKAYDAACTPDFYVFDAENKLAYAGQLDDSRPKSNTPVTGKDLRAALDCVLNNEAITFRQWPSGGCGIKWKPEV